MDTPFCLWWECLGLIVSHCWLYDLVTMDIDCKCCSGCQLRQFFHLFLYFCNLLSLWWCRYFHSQNNNPDFWLCEWGNIDTIWHNPCITVQVVTRFSHLFFLSHSTKMRSFNDTSTLIHSSFVSVGQIWCGPVMVVLSGFIISPKDIS